MWNNQPAMTAIRVYCLSARDGIDPTWPRLAVLVGGVAYFTQAMFIPADYHTNNYLLWILFAMAERMAQEREALTSGAPAGLPAK